MINTNRDRLEGELEDFTEVPEALQIQILSVMSLHLIYGMLCFATFVVHECIDAFRITFEQVVYHSSLCNED